MTRQGYVCLHYANIKLVSRNKNLFGMQIIYQKIATQVLINSKSVWTTFWFHYFSCYLCFAVPSKNNNVSVAKGTKHISANLKQSHPCILKWLTIFNFCAECSRIEYIRAEFNESAQTHLVVYKTVFYLSTCWKLGIKWGH